MDKKPIAALWENVELSSLDEFLKGLDEKLMEKIDGDPAGVWRPMFDFFDSDSNNPLTPREFLQFWQSLSEEEQVLMTFRFC